MSVARTARRRRRQHAIGFRHLAKMGRPIYRRQSAEKAASRLARILETERRIAQKRGKSAKK